MKFSNSNTAYAIAAAIGALTATAIINAKLARKAERANPPAGSFIEIDGVLLHVVERGEGPPLVMFHGNGAMIQDFESSGLIDQASQTNRVIVFDRPGFGHSGRPRSHLWTPAAQADLFHAALKQLGVSEAVILGHSWGTCVAVQMALRHPEMVTSLVLASGYFYPTLQPGFVGLAMPAVPGLGDIIRYTLAPLLSRAMWPLVLRKVFGPSQPPEKFSGFPVEMAVRPSQLRAAAAETGMMIPYAFAARDEYQSLSMPVAIIAGDADRVVSFSQSKRLHREIQGSTLHRLRGAGHMIHQTHTAAVMGAIRQAALSVSNENKPLPAARRGADRAAE
ncbi:alpha/beta hydrolase [Aquabacter sp. CN5-332]